MPRFEPKISIIIPVYNGSKYMREAIDSALAQTYGNVEVLVINDGSSDDGATEAVALSYGDEIQYISKTNGGVATALNAGIAAMSGEYFSWLSHDDAYPPDKLEKQVNFLARLEDREVVVYGDFSLMDSKGDIFHTARLSSRPPETMPYHLLVAQTLHGCTLLVPRSAFEKTGVFPEDLLTTQDYDLWVRMAMIIPFMHIPEVLAYGRQHEEQGSRTISGHKDERRRFFLDNYALLTPAWMRKAFAPEDLPDAYSKLLLNFARAGLYGLYLDALRRSLEARDGLPPSRRPFAIALAAGRGVASLTQVAAENALPQSAWIMRQRLRKIAKRVKIGSFMRPSSQRYFSKIYRKNLFGGQESRSGEGSSLRQTEKLRQALPGFFREIGVRTLLDAPCGDYNWMRNVDFGGIKYHGIDIVEEVIATNEKTYGDALHAFSCLDIANAPLPKADVILCRDCLVHLPHADALNALANFKRSGSTFLLTTTFTDRESNEELRGCWRTLNLEKAPYNLPAPLRLINEGCTEASGAFADKSLGLWRLEDI